MKPRELIEALEKLENEAPNRDVRVETECDGDDAYSEVDNVVLTPRGLELKTKPA